VNIENRIRCSSNCSSGGDGPEAVTPALHDTIHQLTWRNEAVKIAILIADAPPHGLDSIGDTWPNGKLTCMFVQ
jgi:hypothetical protein